LREDDLRVDERFEADFLDDDFFAADFLLDDDFFAADFFDRFGFGGTFPPARRASDSPMAIACLRLVTFLPERPLRSLPSLRSSIAFLTFDCAFLPYFAMSFLRFASWTVLRDGIRRRACARQPVARKRSCRASARDANRRDARSAVGAGLRPCAPLSHRKRAIRHRPTTLSAGGRCQAAREFGTLDIWIVNARMEEAR